MNSALEQARAFFGEGVTHFEAGRLEQAERQFAAALALAPGRPSVLSNLGVVRLKLGRIDEAVDLLQEALAQEPDNAETLAHCALGLAEQGHRQQALALYDRAVALDPRPPAPWMHRGTLLRELGRLDEAAASFQQALARGGDVEINSFYLAGVAQHTLPPAPPRGYVEALFDSYAEGFDTHLTHGLGYQAPQVLIQRVAAPGRSFQRALDLGCGTGLCGRLLRPRAQHLTGVDLSRAMLDQAAASGMYDELAQADVLAFLQAASGPYDLVVAADVFIYVGALDGVFAELARCIPAGGRFCFTVEESTEAELVLRPSLRYAHSEAGLHRLARQHGFRVDGLERAPVRQDQGVPVPGLFVWLERA